MTDWIHSLAGKNLPGGAEFILISGMKHSGENPIIPEALHLSKKRDAIAKCDLDETADSEKVFFAASIVADFPAIVPDTVSPAGSFHGQALK